MFHVSGFLDEETWSVARVIFAKSVMKTSKSMAKADTTNLPVTINAMATKDAFRIVRLILLMIHVNMRWYIVRPCSTNATMFVRPGSVSTTLAAPLATSVAELTAIPTFHLLLTCCPDHIKVYHNHVVIQRTY